jgi:predicted ATPase
MSLLLAVSYYVGITCDLLWLKRIVHPYLSFFRWNTNDCMKLPIPVNIITGGLGTGKTTLISSLIATKQASHHAEERWAILVNEFGSLGIDGSLLDSAAATSQGESACPSMPL